MCLIAMETLHVTHDGGSSLVIKKLYVCAWPIRSWLITVSYLLVLIILSLVLRLDL